MTNHNPTVQSLRLAGNKIKIHHSRISKIDGKLIPDNQISDYSLISCHGGLTEVFITTPEGKDYQAKAICSKLDTFNKKLGVKIGLARCLKQINMPF